MLSFLANQQPIFFKLYLGQEEIVDEFGNATGSWMPIYSNLKSAMLCVSPNKGNSEVEQFGTFADYDRTATTADTSIQIDENSVLWVDGADTDGPWNYIVKKKAPWFNSVQFAIKAVNVSEVQAEQKLIAEAKEKKRLAEIAIAKAVSEDAENQTETE